MTTTRRRWAATVAAALALVVASCASDPLNGAGDPAAPGTGGSPSTNTASAFESPTSKPADAVTTPSTQAATTTLLPSTTLGPPTLLFVRQGGDDNASGRDEANALATPQRAIDLFAGGGTVDIGRGVFPVTMVNGVVASEDNPLVLRGAGGDQTWFSSASYDDDIGLELIDSEHVVIEGLGTRVSLSGFRISASHHITVRNNTLTDLGQEALSVQDFSSDVRILDNVISHTGLRPGSLNGTGYNNFGEGIYIGTGSGSAKDAVNNILIAGNDISHTSSEAIDLKPFTYDLLVENNRIHDLETSTSGAVVIGIGDDIYQNPNAIIRGNSIYNIGTTSPHTDGNAIVLGASAEVYNNVIWRTEHRGILVNGSFANAEARSVFVHHNTVVETGDVPIEVFGGPQPAEASIVNNIGSGLVGNINASPELFVDPDNRDYRLAPDAAAAIDQGVPVAGVPTVDANGNPRPQGDGLDIGAFEFAP